MIKFYSCLPPATEQVGQEEWQSSPSHYAQFMGRTHNGNGWSGIKTIGYAWKNNLAHCWFAEEFPSTYP